MGSRHHAIQIAKETRASRGILAFAAFADSLGGLPDLTPQEIGDFDQFASEQAARWRARYLMSPADAPDELAEAESEAWHEWASEMRQMLTDATEPVVSGVSERLEQLMLLREVAILSATREGSTRRSLWGMLGKSCRAFGLHGAAEAMMRRAIYPRGTVGSR